MKDKKLVICDSDNEYLSVVQAYLQKRKPVGYEVMVCNSIDKVIAASKEIDIEILLIGESTYVDNINDISVQKIFILQENGMCGIKGYSAVSKYQSIENLISTVLDEFARDEECNSRLRRGKKNTKLVTFYSPDRHRGLMTSALAYSEVLTDMGNKVLFLNLEAFSGFEEILGQSYESDITDFMYFALRFSDKLMFKLEAIKHTVHGVDYLPPANDFADIMGIGESEWRMMFDALLFGSEYDYVVVVLTEANQGFYHILERSDRVLNLIGETLQSQAKIRQYEKILRTRDMSKVLENSIIYGLFKDWDRDSTNLHSLSGAAIGGFMRQLLAQDMERYTG